MKLVSFELVSGRSRSGDPAVHQRQQVPAKAALVCVTHEDFLVVLGVDRDFAASDVIALAGERTVETNLFPVAMRSERNPTLRRRLFERGLRLELIDVDVTGSCQEIGGKAEPMLLFDPNR